MPEVVFADFGDDALVFELRFRVNLRQTRKIDVESELRFAIDELFASRGIVMAYPQRDVHLNVMRPVEVRLARGWDWRKRRESLVFCIGHWSLVIGHWSLVIGFVRGALQGVRGRYDGGALFLQGTKE